MALMACKLEADFISVRNTHLQWTKRVRRERIWSNVQLTIVLRVLSCLGRSRAAFRGGTNSFKDPDWVFLVFTCETTSVGFLDREDVDITCLLVVSCKGFLPFLMHFPSTLTGTDRFSLSLT